MFSSIYADLSRGTAGLSTSNEFTESAEVFDQVSTDDPLGPSAGSGITEFRNLSI